MPLEASNIIQENMEWSNPASLTIKIQDRFLDVTAQQVRTTWAQMSETLWKRDQYQLPSAKILLKEYSNDVDVFDIAVTEGIEQLC